eukprot:scaffold10926_cov163-Amphora_coffeaeformis.AAC.14
MGRCTLGNLSKNCCPPTGKWRDRRLDRVYRNLVQTSLGEAVVALVAAVVSACWGKRDADELADTVVAVSVLAASLLSAASECGSTRRRTRFISSLFGCVDVRWVDHLCDNRRMETEVEPSQENGYVGRYRYNHRTYVGSTTMENVHAFPSCHDNLLLLLYLFAGGCRKKVMVLMYLGHIFNPT